MLKDQRAVEQAEKVLREFKAVDYDVKKWNDAVSTFETKAVSWTFRFHIQEDKLETFVARKKGLWAGWCDRE